MSSETLDRETEWVVEHVSIHLIRLGTRAPCTLGTFAGEMGRREAKRRGEEEEMELAVTEKVPVCASRLRSRCRVREGK